MSEVTPIVAESAVRPIVVRPRDLPNVVGLAKSTAYALAKDPSSDFPRPFTLTVGKRPITVWRYDELVTWVMKKQKEQSR